MRRSYRDLIPNLAKSCSTTESFSHISSLLWLVSASRRIHALSDSMVLFHSPLMPNNQFAKGYKYDTPDFDPDKFIDELVEWVICGYINPSIK